MKDVPDGAQNFWEFLVESLHNFLEEIVGADLIKKTFWFFATIFIFIFFTNWFGLLPGSAPSAGAMRRRTVLRSLARGCAGQRGPHMTSAMSLIFMVLWFIWALQSNGIAGFILHIFGPRVTARGRLNTS